jgi:hypothetical protein
MVCKGRETVVKIANRITPNPRGEYAGQPVNISTHLHGAATLAPWDGWADDYTAFDEAKYYRYPNNRAATLWCTYYARCCCCCQKRKQRTCFTYLTNTLLFCPLYLLPPHTPPPPHTQPVNLMFHLQTTTMAFTTPLYVATHAIWLTCLLVDTRYPPLLPPFLPFPISI